jgi:hypothetical protein
MDDGGIYGDMLAAFPELISVYEVFDMEALPGGGYGARHDRRLVEGIFRPVPGGKLGIVGENRQPNQVGTFWVYDEEARKVNEGSFLQVRRKIYLLTKDNDYLREGGYVQFAAAIVPGPTDQQRPDNLAIEKAVDGYQ